MFELYDDSWLWIVVIGFIVAFVLAFGLGANDVANAFGTSVGAKVITVRQACILGTIFEIAGAILVGAKVSNTIRKGIVSPDLFTNGTEEMFIAGNVAALSGSCVWLLVATFFKLPVSGTHSIVGGTLGFSIVLNGLSGINWIKLSMIAASWFLSPLLSGAVSAGLFKVIHWLVLIREKPLENGLKLLPVFYAFTFAVNLFSVFYKGSRLLHFHKIPLYGSFILAIGPSLIIAAFVHFVVVPRQRKSIEEQCVALADAAGDVDETDVEKGEPPTTIEEVFDQEITITNKKIGSPLDLSQDTQLSLNENKTEDGADTGGKHETHSLLNDGSKSESNMEKGGEKGGDIDDAEKRRANARSKIEDKPEVAKLFTVLQVLTAIFGSFAHGGNDVSNAVGPLIAIWITATTGSAAQKAPVPIFVLAYGGVGISVGLWVWGRRVMKTLGEDLTKITPSSGFCIEIGSALTVLLASNIGIPISTTHCKVGSVVFVGRVRSRETVDWRLFTKIIMAWLITLPLTGGLSALVMYILKVAMGS